MVIADQDMVHTLADEPLERLPLCPGIRGHQLVAVLVAEHGGERGISLLQP